MASGRPGRVSEELGDDLPPAEDPLALSAAAKAASSSSREQFDSPSYLEVPQDVFSQLAVIEVVQDGPEKCGRVRMSVRAPGSVLRPACSSRLGHLALREDFWAFFRGGAQSP